MKLRTARRTGKVVLELEGSETGLPASTLPELRLHRILVPIDFSECSRKALQYAASFARQFQAELMLLHVVELPVVTGLPAEPMLPEMEAPEDTAAELGAWAKQSGVAGAKAVVSTGPAYAEIVDTADEGNVDLIVIGTHGRRGLAHLLMGSTAEKVMREAPCPVLVVREREHDFLAGAAGTVPGNEGR